MRGGRATSIHRAERALQPQLWLWSDTSSQKWEEQFLSHRASTAAGTLQKGRSRFWEAEGQQGVPGWAGRVCSCAQFSNGKTKSYPEVIFLSMVVFHEHLCVRQSNTQPRDEARHSCRQSPAGPTAWPGMLCLQSHTPRSSARL